MDITWKTYERQDKGPYAPNTGHYPLWDEVNFIDRDPHWYTHRVKEAIHNINRDSGIKIPEAWMPMIKKQKKVDH